ncbi:MAG: molybdopterin molybdotransferase MoeA [Hyphomicrobiaceae bacterium]|nr:molybdopterin molybdotransferase MoeA [Hyphomicrobiaceae bacterium]
MTRKLRDDCFLHDSDRLTHAEAIAILRERVTPTVGIEELALDDSPSRILAEDVVAPRNIPAHTNAAVDGYAFAFQDYDAKNGSSLKVSARAAAGHAVTDPIEEGTAVRIFTGAAMPEGTDSVVMQEDTDTAARDEEIWVTIPGGLKHGANCRLAGEDVKEGAVMLRAGHRLRPQDTASAAAAGKATLACYKRPRVAVYSTGDEVIRPGEKLEPGQVYDANAPMLKGLIEAAGAECIDLGVLPDKMDTVLESLTSAANEYDVVITSGGASRGDEDHVVHVIEELGALRMWQIAIKPGRPMAFGQIGDCVHLGLPGNPVAVFVCFLLYVQPVLVRLGGGAWPEPARFPLKAAFSVAKKKTGRREFWRGFLVPDNGGSLRAGKFDRDGSGLITGLREADGLIEIGEDVTEVREGDEVAFIPFSEFGIRRF